MTGWFDEGSPIVAELKTLDDELLKLARSRDGTSAMLAKLIEKYPPEKIGTKGVDRAWELAGLLYLHSARLHEALAIFQALYGQMLAHQAKANSRIHKGMPLLWIGEAFQALSFPVHAKRYFMLALCEDAVTGKGQVSPDDAGVYFRLVWFLGLSDLNLKRYASEFWANYQNGNAWYPEALLLEVDADWQTSVPSEAEAFHYVINEAYARSLISQLGSGSGKELEKLASYLLACMPGCRTTLRTRSMSTDYDVVCSMEGFDLDFRSELGRYFVAECKDWDAPAGFTTMAKFCRVLDSTKAKFGILFTKNGITGLARTTDAAREQIKVYQDRGIVIVTVDENDLNAIADGTNLITLLRSRYEGVRLDLSS